MKTTSEEPEGIAHEEPNREGLRKLQEREKTPERETPEVDAEGSSPEGTETPAVTPASSNGRKRRGRKPKPRAGDVLPIPLVKMGISFPYDLAANYLGPHWKLSPQEVDGMVETHLALAAQYVPKAFQKNSALYAVLFQHTLLIIGRVQISAMLAEQIPEPKNEGLPRMGFNASEKEPQEDNPLFHIDSPGEPKP